MLFFDDFESGVAEGWMPTAASSWSIVDDSQSSSKAYEQAPRFAGLYASVAPAGPWSDQVVEARVKVLDFGGTSTADVAALYGRFTDIDNYYAAVLRPDGRAAIRARIAGADATTIKTSGPLGITTNVWYGLRFELVGSKLRLFVDKFLVAEISDDGLMEGRLAVGGANTSATFDDVRVTAP